MPFEAAYERIMAEAAKNSASSSEAETTPRDGRLLQTTADSV